MSDPKSLSSCRRILELISRLGERPSPDPKGVEPGSPVSVSDALRAEINDMVEAGTPILSNAELARLRDREAVDAGKVTDPKHVARVEARRNTDGPAKRP
jgi:hypothetical protein